MTLSKAGEKLISKALSNLQVDMRTWNLVENKHNDRLLARADRIAWLFGVSSKRVDDIIFWIVNHKVFPGNN